MVFISSDKDVASRPNDIGHIERWPVHFNSLSRSLGLVWFGNVDGFEWIANDLEMIFTL
jgi:hypothetical protein